MLRRIKFDDPEKALIAWERYRRLMRFMFVVTFGMVMLAFTLL